jgi:hypothetical protein
MRWVKVSEVIHDKVRKIELDLPFLVRLTIGEQKVRVPHPRT